MTSTLHAPAETAERLRETAIHAVRAAADVLIRHWGEAVRIAEKHRPALEQQVQRLSEEACRETIRGRHPDHALLCGEDRCEPGAGEYLWIVDALDGSVNYSLGLPHFCASVCCHWLGADHVEAAQGITRLGEPQVAAVYAPAACELFVATRGEGATLNQKPIHIDILTRVRDAVVATTFGSTDEARALAGTVNGRLLERVRKLRILGATALDLAYLAAGRLRALYHPGIRTWDIAAGRLLVEESGGILSAVAHRSEPDTWDLLCSAPGIHAALRRIVRG
jgi:myo-inositol-1(or 4)-monophosphatase